MVQYSPYDYSDAEVLKLTEYLKNCARQKAVVHYDDAYNVVRQYGLYHGPHDQFNPLSYWTLARDVHHGSCFTLLVPQLIDPMAVQFPGQPRHHVVVL